MGMVRKAVQPVLPVPGEFPATCQQALILISIQRSQRGGGGNRISGISIAVEKLDQFLGPFMKASWISSRTNTAPIGITPLVRPFAVIMISGVTSK